MDNVLTILDEQLSKYSGKLSSDLKIDENDCSHVASKFYSCILRFTPEQKRGVLNNDYVPADFRIEVIKQSIVFNSYCSPVLFREPNGLSYAHTITLCYTSTSFIQDSFLRLIYDSLNDDDDFLKKCIEYLRKDKIRAFRNGFSHGNWLINGNLIEFWDNVKGQKKGGKKKMEITQSELILLYSFSRSIAYASLSALASSK